MSIAEMALFKHISTNRHLSRYGLKRGRNVHIYEFGGQGFDWCFVRTPDDYDPSGQSYPFVICNHGNGWGMNGTLATANFTSKTQFGVDTQNSGAYLNTSDPLYVEYSNPTIETLLNAGYVVCGAQNYNDLLYGNDNCRNAIQDFYFHMISSFNVQQKCFMLGVSNGMMATLNACWLLGIERVKAIVGLYPLVNLRYSWDYDHTAGVEAAYVLSSATEEQYLAATKTHDPCLVDTIDIGGTLYKTRPLPPCKLWWSSTDTAVPQVGHSQVLTALLNRSTGCIISDIQIDLSGGAMEHGDYRHFDHAAILAWFNKYK